MATMGFDFNNGEAGNVSEVCWKSNRRTNQDDSCQSDFSNARYKSKKADSHSRSPPAHEEDKLEKES